MSIEKAIAERRFAFSRDTKATLVEPPPASLLLDDLPPPIGTLFEWAFRGREKVADRPPAEHWIEHLDALIRQRAVCSLDPAHVYFGQRKECPWCRIEDEGGPAFFFSGGSVSVERLEHLESKLRRLSIPTFPALSPDQLRIPAALEPKRLPVWTKRALPDLAAALLAISVVLCLVGAVSFWPLVAGTAGAMVGGGLLLASRSSRARRRRLVELGERLQQLQDQLYNRAQTVLATHQQRQAAYEESVAKLKDECEHYRTADTNLQDVLVFHRNSERNRFLSSQLIQDHAASIPGMTFPLAAVLQSYGVESAFDIESLKLMGVPMLSSGLTLELLSWRQRGEREFVYKPDHGMTADNMATAGDTAVQRFRISQAQRILMAVKQLDSLASAAAQQLAGELSLFDQWAAPVRAAALELREFQSARGEFERRLNHSPAVILAAALTPPAVGWLLHLVFG